MGTVKPKGKCKENDLFHYRYHSHYNSRPDLEENPGGELAGQCAKETADTL